MDSQMSTKRDLNKFTHNRSAIFSDSTTRALKIEVILDNIFAFLNPESLKCCRMVCMLWKSVSEVLFKEKFRISFAFRNVKEGIDNLNHYVLGPTDLSSFFQNAQQEIPFRALKLKGHLIWTPTALREFFESEGRFITDLILHEVSLAMIVREGLENQREKRYYEKVELSVLLGELINLKRLKISHSWKITTFKLKLSFLSNIQTIDLDNCEVELSEHVLKPVELRLSGVRFHREGHFVEHILVNDFVDLSYLKGKLHLDVDPFNNHKLTKLTVDFRGTCKLDSLFLYHVQVVNLKASAWKIEREAHFSNVSIQEKINVTSRRLKIFDGSWDLNWIPESCVDVHLGKGQWNDEIMQERFNLPNVKCLHMCNLELAKCILPHLSSIFENLVELHFDFPVFGNVSIEITNLPQTLTKMFLNRDGLKLIGDGVKKLDVMGLKCVNLESVKMVLNHFTPENLIIFMRYPDPISNQKLLTILAQKCVSKMIVGIFNRVFIIPSCTADDSPFPIVRQCGELYAFINGIGGFVKCNSYLEAKQYLCNGELIEIE